MIATAAKEPPKERSSITHKNFAGGALYHRKPKQDPTIEPQKIAISPTPGICIVFVNIQKK